MRLRGLIMLGVAIILAIVAVLIARGYLQQQSQPVVQVQPAVQTTTVVVARQRLDFAVRLGPENVQEVQWPVAAVPPGTFKKVGEIIKPGEDRIVLRSIEPGEPIFAAKVSGTGQRAALSAIIDKEMRAVTIRVNDVVGVAGFVLPGDRVDVLLTRIDATRGGGGGQDNTITDILLQNVRVLAIDQSASDRQEKPAVVRSVTVEISPQQAQKLTLASQVGTLTLALRSEANTDAAALRTVAVSDLRGGEAVRPLPQEPKVIIREVPVPMAPPPAPAASGASVKIIRGLKGATEEQVPAEAAGRPRRTSMMQAPDHFVAPGHLATKPRAGAASIL